MKLGCLVKLVFGRTKWYVPKAKPVMELEALHGVVKLPVAVQVRLNQPAVNVIVLAVDARAPSLSVHW